MGLTVVDVAKRASVSVATVSRVLNNLPNVSTKRKRRVLSAMEELNYKPNLWARGIRKASLGKQVGQIALVFINLNEHHMHAPYMLQYIHGVQQELSATRRKCLFLTWNEKPDDDAIPHILLDGEIDGIIVKGELRSEASKRWLNRFTRVYLNPTFPVDCDCIMVDYQAGTREQVEYLSSLGHRRIAIISPIESFRLSSKFIGYKRAIKEFGLDVDEALVQVRSVPSESDFTWAIDNLWSLDSPPTAIMSNDYSCGGIYKTLISRGLKIPQDVSVIGYDNSPNYCEALIPELTSMDIKAANIGKAAVQQLLLRIKNPDEGYRKILIQGKMVERESVKDRTTGNRQ